MCLERLRGKPAEMWENIQKKDTGSAISSFTVTSNNQPQHSSKQSKTNIRNCEMISQSDNKIKLIRKFEYSTDFILFTICHYISFHFFNNLIFHDFIKSCLKTHRDFYQVKSNILQNKLILTIICNICIWLNIKTSM